MRLLSVAALLCPWLLLIPATAGCAPIRVLAYPERAEVWLGSSGRRIYPEHDRESGAPKVEQPVLRSEIGEVLRAASALLGQSRLVVDGRQFPSDCSGFVRASYWGAGVDILAGEPDPAIQLGTDSLSGRLYALMKTEGRVFKRGKPLPGDVIFFENTTDRNRNGRVDDPFTHVALVRSVDPSGTIEFLHFGSGVVKIGHMNLEQPSLRQDPSTGAILNDYVRRRSLRDPAGTKYTAGDLFVAFGRPSPRVFGDS